MEKNIFSSVVQCLVFLQGCNKRFTEYSSLYKHHIVHSQQKPYYCSLCSRNYRQAYTLTMHKRTAHGIIEGEDGNDIVLDEDLAAELFANSMKRKRPNVTVQPTEVGIIFFVQYFLSNFIIIGQTKSYL